MRYLAQNRRRKGTGGEILAHGPALEKEIECVPRLRIERRIVTRPYERSAHAIQFALDVGPGLAQTLGPWMVAAIMERRGLESGPARQLARAAATENRCRDPAFR